MKAHLLQTLLEEFKSFLTTTEDYPEVYKYECVKNFQAQWSLDADDLSKMLDRSLSSKISSRLWGGRRNSAKSFMLLCLEAQPDFMRSAFTDLLDESKEIALRVSRFQFYCDEMLSELQKKNKKLNFHFHDLRMISVYLSFRYPEKYNIFHYKPFLALMEDVELPELPKEFELERFFKLSKGIKTMMQKDEELISAHQNLLNTEEFYKEDCMLIVHDFMSWNKYLKGKD